MASSSNNLNLYRKSSGVFSLFSTESCTPGYPTEITLSHDCQWLAWACTNNDVKIFQNLPPFTLVQTVNNAFGPTSLAISDSALFLVTQVYLYIIYYFSYNGSEFVPGNSKSSTGKIVATQDMGYYAQGLGQSTLEIHDYDNITSSSTVNFTYTFSGSTIDDLAINANGTIITCINNDQNLYIFY